jgi:rRNA maturation protein Nop10
MCHQTIHVWLMESSLKYSLRYTLTMKCKLCKGKVMVDRVFSTQTHIELFCMTCGKRWSFHHPQNHSSFVKWLQQKETELSKKTSNS